MTKLPTNQKERIYIYQKRIAPLVNEAPWVLRVTEHKDRTPPVFVVKQRRYPEESDERHGRPYLKERGVLWGDSQRRLLPIVRNILSRVLDPGDQPLELHRFLDGNRIAFRGNLPLDGEAGAKLALMFKLQERVKEGDRVELMARRVSRFTEEEAAYWFSRIVNFGPDANRWALAGMKVMLGGQAQDPGVERMLENLRQVV